MNILLFNERGSALVLIFIILVILSAIAASFLMISSVETQLSTNKVDMEVSFHAADAGIEFAKNRIMFDTTWEDTHRRQIDETGFPSTPWSYISDPKDVWEEGTIPNPDGTISYYQVWVESRPYYDTQESEVKYRHYIMSRGSHERAVKIIEAQYHIPVTQFKFAYFAEEYIHLDNHNQAAEFVVGSSVFTNGEFELSGDMEMRKVSDDDYVAALGHVSIGGTCYNDIYAPSVDTYGPDGLGKNTQTFPPFYGTIYGNVYLMDGWRINPSNVPGDPSFIAMTVANGLGVDGGSYGFYDSVAANDIGEIPGSGTGGAPAQTNVIVHSDAIDIRDNPNTAIIEGKVYSYDGVGGNPGQYDPNDNIFWALRTPNKGGKVLLRRELPTFMWMEAYDQAVADGTQFNTPADFQNYLRNNAAYISINSSTYYELGLDSNGDGVYEEALWYIGDGPDDNGDGVVDLAEIDEIKKATLWNEKNDGVIIHGGLVIEGGYGNQTDKNYHIYGCGNFDVTEDASGNLVGYGLDYNALSPPVENPTNYGFPSTFTMDDTDYRIPYLVPAIVASNKVEFKRKKSDAFAFVHGIVYSMDTIHVHNKNIASTHFIIGAESCVIIHNCLWMVFLYNSCVASAGNKWFYIERPEYLEIVDWQIVQ